MVHHIRVLVRRVDLAVAGTEGIAQDQSEIRPSCLFCKNRFAKSPREDKVDHCVAQKVFRASRRESKGLPGKAPAREHIAERSSKGWKYALAYRCGDLVSYCVVATRSIAWYAMTGSDNSKWCPGT